MDGTAILNTASSMLETYGDGAKFHIAEQMDRALESGDAPRMTGSAWSPRRSR